jgi:hypothetical protein
MFLYQFNYFCGQVLELCPDWPQTSHLCPSAYSKWDLSLVVLVLFLEPKGGEADTFKFNLHIIGRAKKGCEFNQKRCEFKNVLKLNPHMRNFVANNNIFKKKFMVFNFINVLLMVLWLLWSLVFCDVVLLNFNFCLVTSCGWGSHPAFLIFNF